MGIKELLKSFKRQLIHVGLVDNSHLMTIENYLRSLKKQGFSPKNILDIGANVGNFGKFCKQLFTDSEILMIEGNENCEQDLKRTGLNYKIALLGDKKRKVKFHLNPKNPKCTGSSYYKEITHHYTESIEVEKELTTLSVLVQENFDLIKLDTQGSELDIIKGGEEIIKAAQYVIIEAAIKEYNVGSPKSHEIIATMEKLGFIKFKEIEKHIWNSKHPQFQQGEAFQVDMVFYK